MSLIEDSAFPERAGEDVVEGVAPVFHFVAAIDQDIGSNTKAVERPSEPQRLREAVALRPERLGLDYDQIDVRLRPGLAACAGADRG